MSFTDTHPIFPDKGRFDKFIEWLYLTYNDIKFEKIPRLICKIKGHTWDLSCVGATYQGFTHVNFEWDEEHEEWDVNGAVPDGMEWTFICDRCYKGQFIPVVYSDIGLLYESIDHILPNEANWPSWFKERYAKLP